LLPRAIDNTDFYFLGTIAQICYCSAILALAGHDSRRLIAQIAPEQIAAADEFFTLKRSRHLFN